MTWPNTANPVDVRIASLVAETYTLLTDADATGDPVDGIVGGSYIWALAGTIGGATVKLQALGPDGSTYVDVDGASLTAAGTMGVAIGSNATIRAVVTGGAPSGLYSNLS